MGKMLGTFKNNRGSLNLELSLLIMLFVLACVLSLVFLGNGISNKYNSMGEFLLALGGGAPASSGPEHALLWVSPDEAGSDSSTTDKLWYSPDVGDPEWIDLAEFDADIVTDSEKGEVIKFNNGDYWGWLPLTRKLFTLRDQHRYKISYDIKYEHNGYVDYNPYDDSDAISFYFNVIDVNSGEEITTVDNPWYVWFLDQPLNDSVWESREEFFTLDGGWGDDYPLIGFLDIEEGSVSWTSDPTGNARVLIDNIVIQEVDGDGNVIDPADWTPPDVIPPSQVANVVVTPIGGGNVSVSWDAATDNVGVTGYRITRFDGSFVQAEACNGGVVALRQDGTAEGQSYNNYEGQANVQGWTNIKQITSYYNATVGLKNDGTLVCAGDVQSAATVSAWTGIKFVDNSQFVTAGVKNDGTVVAAGYNIYGTPGLFTVGGWTDVKKVSVAENHIVALKNDGTLLISGTSNIYGELAAAGWTGLTDVSCGEYNIVGVKADGTVVCSGLYSGTGDISGWDSPANHILGWTGIKEVAAGPQYTAALKTNGTVVANGAKELYGCWQTSGWTGMNSVNTNGSSVTYGIDSYGKIVSTNIYYVSVTDEWCNYTVLSDTTTGLSYETPDILDEGTYWYTVAARDAAGNWGAESIPAKK